MKIKELREKAGKVLADARAIGEKAKVESREQLTAEERQTFDKYMLEHEGYRRQIRELEADEKRFLDLAKLSEEENESRGRQTGGADPGAGGEQRGGGGGGGGGEARSMEWRTAGGHERRVHFEGRRSSREYQDEFRSWIRTGRVGQLLAKEGRDLQADSDVDGGFLVAPMQMSGAMIKALDAAVYIRQLATVIPLVNARSLGETSLDADPDDGEWTGEIQTGSADTSMKLGRRALNPTLCSKLIKVSTELLRLAPSAESLVIDRLSYKFGVTQEKNFLTGDGANKPLGVFVASNAGISTGRDVSTGNTTTAIGADNLIRCKYALKRGYRNKPSTSWMFHTDAMIQIALLKDGNGQYLWRQGLTANDPDKLLNIPIAESEFAPNTFTTGQYVGMLADWSFYHIAESLGLSFQRLVELYALSNQVGIVGRLKADGMPVLEEAFVRVKLA